MQKPHSNPTENSKFIRAGKLAARIGVTPRTLFRWSAAGLISRFRINRRLTLFNEAEVLDFVGAAHVGDAAPVPSYRRSVQRRRRVNHGPL